MFEFFDSIKLSIDKGFFAVENIQYWLIAHITDLLLAIVTFVIGQAIARLLRRAIDRIIARTKYDKTVMNFVSQIVYYMMIAVVVLIAADQMGIPMTSFIAGFGAIGIGIGLALQNNMSNFASGLMILFFQTFKVGDYIVVDGAEGTVKNIHLMNTAIVTRENKTVFIPNSLLTSQKLTNSSYMRKRYIQFVFDISYDNDHHKAIKLLKEIFKANKLVLNANHMEIGIIAFGDNAVQIRAMPLVKNENYWAVYYRTMSEVKDKFDANGIDIPYPQRVVYVKESVENTQEPVSDVKAAASDIKNTQA